ncbi:MAG: ferric reductase-like transmembrane domain-containing protein [Acidimicrobiales bacterium]|jgi:DMSO/TMAO reductase YedYZ heme-binding membrane subunit
MTSLPALVVPTSGTALWYLTRASGVVALVLLTTTVMVGIVASVGWTTERWPRFLSQNVHRDLSLLCLGFVAVHIASTVGDGYVPIGLADAFVPFHSPYRPLWVGLGAVAFDLLLAVLVTSALRRRIGYRSWRFVHRLAYLCWPVAVLHGLGTGSDATLDPVLAVDACCTLGVLAVVAWRLVTVTTIGTFQRLVGAVVAVIVTVSIGVVAALGPLRPGWSHRSGTSSALLAQIATRSHGPTGTPVIAAPTTATTAPAPNGAAPGAASGTLPPAPFSIAVAGTQSTVPDAAGEVRITLALHLQDPASTPLTIELDGTAVPGGGVSLTQGSVAFGPFRGTVTALAGDTIEATVPGAGPVDLTVTLSVDQGTGALSGTVVGALVGGDR